MDYYGSEYYEYPGGSYLNDPNTMRMPGDDNISLVPSTSRSSESGSSRHSRIHGLSFDVERRISHESKPRLSKDQQEILERHFQKYPKPSTLIKKEFSEKLGVSLDKVNNWFQNRRAKVKQEAKKQQSATMMHYATQMAHAQFNSDPSYMYPIVEASQRPLMVPGGLQISIPSDFTEPLVNGTIDHFGHMVDSTNTPFSQVVGEPTFDDSPEVFNTFFGLDDSFQTYSNNFNHHALVDFGKQFKSGVEGREAFQPSIRKLEAFGSSSSVSALTQCSSDDMSLGLHMASDDSVPALTSRNTSNNPLMMSATSAPQLVAPTPLSATHSSVKRETEAEQQLQPTVIPHQLFALENTPEPSVSVPPMSSQVEHQLGDNTNIAQESLMSPLQGEEEMRPEPNIHADSGLSNLANAVAPKSPSSEMALLKSPNLGLAARRRNRPAALGSASMRTVSFNNSNTPVSPKHGYSDPQLRRIKSNGIINGRVQKIGIGSGQRSPFGATFPDGSSTTPKIARQMSLQSLDAVALESSNTGTESIPMTPLSPMDAVSPQSSHHQQGRPYSTIMESEFEPPSSMWSNVPGTTAVMSAPFWACGPSNGEPMLNYASPPCTPMDYATHREQFPHVKNTFSPIGGFPSSRSDSALQQSFNGPHVSTPVSQPLDYLQSVPIHANMSTMPQYQQQSMAPPPHYMGGNGQQPMFRSPMVPHEDANVAAYLAGQQQFARHSSAHLAMPVHGLPAMSTTTPHPHAFSHAHHSSADLMHQPMHHFQPQAVPFGQIPRGHQQPFIHTHSSLITPQHQPQQETPPPFFDHSNVSYPVPTGGRSNSVMSINTSPNFGGGNSPSSTMLSNLTLGSPISGGMTMTPTKPSSPELFIHEYSPREPADPSRLPPKTRTTTPRTYSFQHTGPENFCGSP